MAIVNTILRDTDWQAIIVSNITAHTTANSELVSADELRYWTTGNSALSISRIKWSGSNPAGGVSVLFDATTNVTMCHIFGNNGSYGGTDGGPGFKMQEYGQFTTNLSAAITNSVTTIGLDDTRGFASAGMVVIGTENITYTAKSTAFGAGNLTGCTRAANGSTAAAHLIEAEVKSMRPIGYTGDVLITPAAAFTGTIITEVHKVVNESGAGWGN
jgi:hypothetical protein